MGHHGKHDWVGKESHFFIQSYCKIPTEADAFKRLVLMSAEEYEKENGKV